MKSYLSLIPIQAKVHRKQSRMTRICIFLAVFLVTVIFGMADVEIQSQRIAAIMDGGNWHVAFRDLTEEDAELIGTRVEVRESTWYGMLDTDSPASIEGIRAVICGLEESGLDMFPSLQLVEGTFPSEKDQVIATENLKERLGYEIGDQIILQLSEGEEIELQVTGFAEGTAMTDREDRIGLVFDMDGFRTHFSGREDTDSVYYVQLSPFCNMQKAIDDICGQFHLKENQALQYGKLMGLTGQSEDSNMQQLYIAAAVLAVLVIVAGVLMISSSLNSSMSQRTEFLGMLRCLGATRKQVIRFVKREALRWCAAAIPAGLLSGSLAILILVRFLKWISPAYFESMPDFGISVIGLVSGCLVGIVTVLLSSRAPARKASRVSPLQAVSGNASAEMPVKKAANTRFFKVETAMGIHHAKASRKNLILMSGSFALSIVLFLSFSTTLDFMHHAIVPMRPYTPDLYIQSADGTCAIPKDLAGQIVEMDGVKRVFGRSFANHLTARIDGQERDICLVSYEEHQFGWAREMLNEGEADEAEAGNGLLAAYQGENTLELGKSVSFGEGKEYPVTGILSDSPFTVEEGTLLLICSETVFEEVTGENGYTILDIQLERGTSDEEVSAIRRLSDDSFLFSDQRAGNESARGAYYAMCLCVYGFLAVIMLITVFHIVNSISMSTTARMKQYGAMRAIGMSVRQTIRMIAAEAFVYGALGILAGCILGIPLNNLLFRLLITVNWGEEWSWPVGAMAVILLVVAASVFLSVLGPAQRIRTLSVVNTINAE